MSPNDTYEQLTCLKRLEEDPAFVYLCGVYDREQARLNQRLFDSKTGDEQALRLRAALIELDKMHPAKLLSWTIETCREKVERANRLAGYPSKTPPG